MDEQLVFQSDKATYTAEAGNDLLGGGQTAAVYRVRAEDGQVYALKWLIDSVYEQRFFQEVDWLNEFYTASDEYGLKRDGQSLTPRVYDEQRQGEQRFFVLDLAPGQPLDELLRRVGRMPEPVAIAIAEQLARVFTALHEILDRSYLDFQPRNVFWQEQSGQIMVIDWNLLSAKGRPDVRTDLRSIGTLLYRMVLGVLPPVGGSEARGVASAHERWQDVSLGVRVLLQDLLEPRLGQRIESARTARERLEDLRRHREKAGDDLVREAAVLFKQARNGEAATIQDALLLDAAIALDLAGRQTGALALSSAMALVRHNLEQEIASRREELTALARAISFFRSGDLDTAALLFEQALTEADMPEDELQVRRWQAVLEARHSHSAGFDGAGRQQIEALLEQFQETTRAYLDRSLSPKPDLVAWRRMKAEAEMLRKDIAAVEALVAEASAWPVILALQAGDWPEVPGGNHTRQIASANQAKDAITALPYADTLWTVLGVGDERASMTAVEDAISVLEDAVQAEKQWRRLSRDAREERWSKISETQIRRLFEESENVLPGLESIFELLAAVIGKGQDGLAAVLFEGLATNTSLTETDRRRAQALEQWLQRMERLERFVSIWSTQVSAESTDQDLIAEATPSTALDVSGEENPATLSFPASWVLSELRSLSQESFVKNLCGRLVATATQTVQICVREIVGLAQARLMIDHLTRDAWIDHGSKEWRLLQDELESAQVDQRYEETRKAIKMAMNELQHLEAELAQKDTSLADLAKAIESADERKRTVDQQIKEYERSQKHRVDQEIEGERASRMRLIDEEMSEARVEIRKEQEIIKQMRTEKAAELDALQAEKDALLTEVTELREGKRQLTATTAVTSRQLQELEQLRKQVTGLDKRRVELEQENSSLKFRNEKLPQTVISDSATLQASGWQRLYEASKLLQSGVLSDVKNALDVWHRVAEESPSADKLHTEAKELINTWESRYNQNCARWLKTSGSHHEIVQLEVATGILEQLLAEGIRGYSRPDETQLRLAHLWQDTVDAIQATLLSGRLNSQQHHEALQKMYSYTNKSGQLANKSTDPNVRNAARRIRDIYNGWVPSHS